MKIIYLLIFSIVLFFSCKNSDTNKTEPSGNKPVSTTLLMPDSIKTQIDTMVKSSAVLNSCRLTVMIANDSGASYYTGYDGRSNTSITDYSGSIDIGSCSKMFTATSILQLIEQKKLSLQDRLTAVLPNDTIYRDLLVLDGKNYIDSVRILNLLNHSSGFPEYFIEGDDDKEIALHGDSTLRFTPYELIVMAKKTNKPAFKPGTQFKYCNVNYILLGLIIEKLTGQTWQQYVQEHIIDPLGLKHTFFASMNSPAGRTPGHFKGKESQMPATLAGAAGEIISTLDDMHVFISSWGSGKLFSNPATMDHIKKEDFLEMMGPIRYGKGVIDLTGLSLGHGGQTFGFQSYMGVLPNGYTFVFGMDDAAASAWEPAIFLSTLINKMK